ncbi:MAG TPA: zf-HC2 domain-containing protein [Bryobacteraceae bacterium]|nr:zf-HC2 domain-containing protein [Bryobacteraceae bacterium]
MGCSPETCSLEDGVAEELIVGYAARTLDPEAETAFERHLESCGRCRRLAAQQGAVWSALDSWRPQAVSPDFDQKLARRIAADQHIFSRLCAFAKLVWRPVLPLAAISAVLIGFFLLRDDDAPGRALQTQPSARIEQQVEHALDDMDMLKQIGVDVSAPHPVSSRKI